MIRYAPVPNGSLAYETSGQGPITLVFLHGFSLDRRMWSAQVAALCGQARCIAYDLRGFGKSALPDDTYDHVDDLLRLLTTLSDGENGRVILVGLSLGANVALSAASQHPDLMDGLVLVSSGLIGYDWGDDTRPPQEINRIAATDGPEAARAAWLGHALFAPLAAHPPALAAFRAMVADYSGWHWQQPNRDARIAPVGPLDEIRVPTLVVSGDLDVRGYRDIARELARAIPTADLVRIPDAGHMLPLEAPETFNAVLSGFLDRCAGPNAA